MNYEDLSKRERYEKGQLYHLQVNLVKGKDDDIIKFWKQYKGSKVDLIRNLFRKIIK